ncbi:MAG: ATP-binding cassette domain-containing protein [Pseudomonadota bacterium]
MLILSDVTKRYGKRTILNGVTAEFPQGICLIEGPSGAGKSTLLRLCATVESPNSGNLAWDGKPMRSQRGRFRRGLGYAPQAVSLPLNLTGREFLHHMAALKGGGGAIRAQADHYLEGVGLGETANTPILAYSGGMKRRLILCQALLGAPHLLALDEPTAELDSKTATRMVELISEAAKTAVVLVTTHLAEPFRAAGARAFAFADGQVHTR